MKDRLILPKKDNLGKLEDKDLDGLTKLIYHPVFGLFYRMRYKIANHLLDNSCDRILEIGFGPGLFMPTLSKKCNFLYGIDIHGEIEKTKEMLKKESVINFCLVNADIYEIPFKEGTFDAIICLSTLEHLKELDSAIKEIVRVLKEDGQIVIGFPMKNKLTKRLLNLIGYNDETIHPSGQSEIFESCFKKLILEKPIFYPKILGRRNSLYFTGRFRKDYHV